MTIWEKIAKCASKELNMFQKLLLLFIIGSFMIFVGVILLMVAAVLYGKSSVSFGGLIFIGPFPIVVGAGSEATWIVLFAIVLAVLSVIMFLIIRREIKKANF